MRFSEYFKLGSNNQKDYEFLNIRIDWDNLFFIDPTRIEAETDRFSVECEKIIQDYFETILNLYDEGKINKAKSLMTYSGESNEVFLGYTNGFPDGIGNSEEGLEKVFNYVHAKDLISKGLVGKIEDLHVFVEDFGPDKMSDLIASILKKNLIDFTIEQCRKYNIDRRFEIKKRYWDNTSREWKEVNEYLPLVNVQGKESPVVLIPKKYGVSSFLYDSNKYWEKIISNRRQKYHKENNTQLYQNKASRGILNKDYILEDEADGRSLKEYLIDSTIQDIEAIESFRNQIKNTQRSSNNNNLSDDEIDKLLLQSLDNNPTTIKVH